MDHAHGSDLVEVDRARSIDALVALGQDDEHSVALLNVVDEFDRTFPSDRQRYDCIWKNDGIADGKNRQFCWNRLNLLLDIIKLFEVTFHWF